MEKQKVIVIGAGPAGLTVAYELLNKNYEVVILEESDSIGGISKTVKHNGNKMDIGGHRFFSKNDKVMEFWKDIMPIQGKKSFDDEKLEIEKPLEENGPDPNKEDNVMLIRRRVSRIYYNKRFFDYPISINLKTIKNMGILKTVQAGLSYIKASIFKRKEESLEDFYINHFGKVLYKMFFESYTEKIWGRHPSQISKDWGAQRVKGISIATVIKDLFNRILGKKNSKNTETSLIEEYWYPKYGPGQLWETLAERIIQLGGQIKFNYKVEKINFENGKIKSLKCKNNEQIDGDIFISSMPINNLVNGFTNIEIPEEIKNIAQGLPFVDFITVGILVDKLKLENKTNIKTLGNVIPDCWIYVQEPDVKMCRMQIFNNWSPYLVRDVENTVWVGLEYTCKENDEYWNMDKEKFIDFAINELVKMGIIDKEDVKDSHLEKVKKAYPAYFDTYKDIDKLIEYLNKIDNLYCIGRNGQHRYNNMDHSVLTAFEVANNITNNVKERDNIWKVNTEKEYHEEK